MKLKATIILAVLFTAFLTNAQEETKKNNISPSKGSFSFEVDFLPFSNSGPINLNAFRGRYFLSDKLVLNLNFNFDSKKQHYESPSSYQNYLVFDTEDGRFTVFGLGSGLEYHFLPESRISPYIGVNATYEMKRSSYESIDHVYNSYPVSGVIQRKTEVENAWPGMMIIGIDQFGNPVYSYMSDERAYNSIKANVVLGADIYIIKHLYMGFELGMGLDSKNYKEVVIKVDGNLDTKYPKASDLTFGLNFNNALRLGIWF